MRRFTLVSAAFAGAAALALLGGGLTQAASARTVGSPTGVLIQADRHQALPLHGGTVDSLNWSGYAVTPAGDGITAVTSTFVVPKAGTIPPGFAATWTGIGGYSTKDLIQAGTAEQSLPSLPIIGDQYYAWYELLPNTEVQLTKCTGDPNCTVNPGDEIGVSISLVSGTTWHIAMLDVGHWTWSLNVSYTSSKSSAEWVLEAPSLVVVPTVVAPVGTVAFGPDSTYTVDGVTKTIAAGDPTEIVMSPGLIAEATPSALASGGESFNDCAYASSCPTP